ncbi:MAG TPA: ATP-dependent DNA helicase UvrD2 [Acidimicrobiales bacterium]|jgi:DNA helicase-2/ATP-dependent DNA helicase PcrA|nr:ATP-dependent DNA helicase UvrD2 [Acidimicrobiales bacterium]
MESDALLEGLNDAQREAVTTEAAPLAIIAGAGSGKTRVLTRRIAYRCVNRAADARHVLALTFTRKAAGELRARLRQLGLRDDVAAGTFHALAYAQLRGWWADRGTQPPSLLERKGRLLGRLLGRTSSVQAIDVAGEIEWAKARLVTPDQYAVAAMSARRSPPVEPARLAELYTRYEDEKRRQRQVDFDDLLWLCLRAVEVDGDFAAAQRWRFRHLFVDEFQDVNPLQFRLLQAWRGDRRDMCVVGDPHQAIYSWNGADSKLLLDIARLIPGTSTVSLEQNYRSSPQIIATANHVLDSGAIRGLRLRATCPEGPVPAVRSMADDRSEARGVARAVLDRHRPGIAWSHQAVLTRTNAQTVLIAEACRSVGVPVRVRGQLPYLELPEVREALRTMQRGRAPLAEHLAALEARLSASEDQEDSLPDAELDRLRNLEELVRLSSEYTTADPAPTVAGFMAWLSATLGRDDAGVPGDAVDLATFHAAKGLEWPVVHLAGLEDGLVPIGRARTEEAVAEERRLFYVAVTRAERELCMTWAAERTFGSKVVRRRPSPYLDDLEPLLDALAAGSAPADAARSLNAVREAARASRGQRTPRSRSSTPDLDPANRALFDELRTWRMQRAKAANVPAYVIFDDKTLVAVATRRPRDRVALRSVPGIGPVKSERFAGEVLEIVGRHAEQVG